MQLIINGEEKEVAVGTVAELLGTLGLNASQVAVEQNGVIVPRSTHPVAPLKDKDRIEIVRFIGGG